jgi:hypothetical protein
MTVASGDFPLLGIHSTGGDLTYLSGTANKLNIAGGTVTLGEAEDPSSTDYGKQTAHVSISDPQINQIVWSNNGTFNYYDGRINNQLSVPPTDVEYMYEPCYNTHTDVTPSQTYTSLLWMRDGQSQCGNQ